MVKQMTNEELVREFKLAIQEDDWQIHDLSVQISRLKKNRAALIDELLKLKNKENIDKVNKDGTSK